MTKLFISPITPTTDCTPFYALHQAIRESVAASMQVMNLNRGWDVIGWCHRDEVADALANQEAGKEVPDINQPIHISYLYPCSADAVTQIEQMKFTPSNENERESER
jgi:hypothetical protein